MSDDALTLNARRVFSMTSSGSMYTVSIPCEFGFSVCLYIPWRSSCVMPTRRTLPKLTMTAWTRPTPLKSHPPSIASSTGCMSVPKRWPRPTGTVQFHCVLMACRTLVVGFITRPYLNPRNADPPSIAYW